MNHNFSTLAIVSMIWSTITMQSSDGSLDWKESQLVGAVLNYKSTSHTMKYWAAVGCSRMSRSTADGGKLCISISIRSITQMSSRPRRTHIPAVTTREPMTVAQNQVYFAQYQRKA